MADNEQTRSTLGDRMQWKEGDVTILKPGEPIPPLPDWLQKILDQKQAAAPPPTQETSQ